MLHAIKGKHLTNILAHCNVSPDRTLLGFVSRDLADVFWVRCSAGELPHHGTWRHCVMWDCAMRGHEQVLSYRFDSRDWKTIFFG
ncbi:MAG: hypothetical protein ACKPKO_41040, partial [Candidatus Fonsibacter sp.]